MQKDHDYLKKEGDVVINGKQSPAAVKTEEVRTSTLSVQSYQHPNKEELTFRKPTAEDGTNVWKLIRSTKVLDLNSPYSYLMLCKYFSDTCVIAEEEGRVVGFVSAFIQPEAPDVIFVWQVAVDHTQRGKGLAKTLLRELLKRESCTEIRYLEATISPSNNPSQSLFEGLARDMNTHCQTFVCFSEDLFPNDDHEPEWTYRIGPFQGSKPMRR